MVNGVTNDQIKSFSGKTFPLTDKQETQISGNDNVKFDNTTLDLHLTIQQHQLIAYCFERLTRLYSKNMSTYLDSDVLQRAKEKYCRY